MHWQREMVTTGSCPLTNQDDSWLRARLLAAWPPEPVPETAKMAFRDDAIPLKHSGQAG